MADKESRRTCFKCGRSPAADGIKLFRFPNPGIRNLLRCVFWETYIFPDNIPSLEVQRKLFSEHRMLCQNHFEDEDFTDSSKQSLLREAVPSDVLKMKERRIHAPPCKKIKPDKQPPKQQIGAVEEYVTEKHNCKVENTGFDSPNHSHSDIPDTVPEPEPQPFSWQKSLPICVETDDIPSDIFQSNKEVPLLDLVVQAESYNLNNIADASTNDNEDEKKFVSEKHAEFSCDHCLGEIIGFRYTCVQCDNFDLCSSCENQLLHPHHYMLRVSKPRPFNELRSVIEAIRIKLKLLEEGFKQNSDDWADVMIKKEEDPLEMQKAVSHAPAIKQPLKVFVVPNADINGSLESSKQDLKSPSKDIHDKTSNLSLSTAAVQISTQKNTANSKKRNVLGSTLDNDAVFVENNVKANLILAPKRLIANANVYVKQNTSISNSDIRLDNSKYFSNKSIKLAPQNADPIYFQQNKKPKTDEVKYLQKYSATSNVSFQDTVMKNNLILSQNIGILIANDDSNTNEMFEEYLDEVWLDESILADNSENDKALKTKKKEFNAYEDNKQVDQSKESEGTIPKVKNAKEEERRKAKY